MNSDNKVYLGQMLLLDSVSMIRVKVVEMKQRWKVRFRFSIVSLYQHIHSCFAHQYFLSDSIKSLVKLKHV